MALALAVVGAAVVGVTLLRTPRLRRAAADRSLPVSVIVPARDEAHTLPGLLASLAGGTCVPTR